MMILASALTQLRSAQACIRNRSEQAIDLHISHSYKGARSPMSNSIIVIGGGIVGASIAYYAARDGHRVTLFEQESMGYGASSRNAGFVWLHCRNRGWALDTSLAGRALYEELQDELPVPFEFRGEGGLIYFTEEAQAPIFEEFVAARSADGLDMELIDRTRVRELVGPIRDDVVGASYCANDAQINTGTVVNAIAAGARDQGATLHEGLGVEQILFDGEGRAVGVVTSDRQRHTADYVVVATGAWTEKFMEASGWDVRIGRERLQVLATKPQPAQIGPVVYGPATAKQYSLFRDLPSYDESLFLSEVEQESESWMLTLAAQRASGEILLGCPMDYPAEVDHDVTIMGVLATLRSIVDDFPGLKHVKLDRFWSGTLPVTSDMVPIIDEAAPGLVIAAGHTFGNSTGPMTGKLVVQLLNGETPEIDLSEVRWDRHLDPIVPGVAMHW